MSDLSPPSTPAPARGLIIGSLIALAIAVIGLLMLFVSPTGPTDWTQKQQAELDAGLDFPPITIDEDRLHRERQQFYGEPDSELVQEEIDLFFEALFLTNANQFRVENPVLTEEGQDPANLLPYLADEILPVVGPDGFHVVAQPIYDQCLDGLEELTDDLAAGRISFGDALTDPGPDYDLYRESCGHLLDALVEYRLIDDQGRWHIDQPLAVVDLLQRYRLAELIRNRFPLHRQLTDYDLESFHRWRIQHSQAMDVELRRQFLDQASSFIDDETYLAIAGARLDVKDGQSPDEAFEPLREQFPDDPFVQKFVDTVTSSP